MMAAMLRIPVDYCNIDDSRVLRPTLWTRLGGDRETCKRLGPLYAWFNVSWDTVRRVPCLFNTWASQRLVLIDSFLAASIIFSLHQFYPLKLGVVFIYTSNFSSKKSSLCIKFWQCSLLTFPPWSLKIILSQHIAFLQTHYGWYNWEFWNTSSS